MKFLERDSTSVPPVCLLGRIDSRAENDANAKNISQQSDLWSSLSSYYFFAGH